MELIEQWLQAEPLNRAKNLIERLIAHNHELYGQRHLRTLQRRLRGYRLQQIELEMKQNLSAPLQEGERDEQGHKLVLPGFNEYG